MDRKEVLKLIKSGSSYAKIGEKFNVSRQRISQIAIENGIKLRSNDFYWTKKLNLDDYVGLYGLPNKTRLSIFNRDNWCCRYCGKSKFFDKVRLTIDHIIPFRRGGVHTSDNLVTACNQCNASKNWKTLEEWRPELMSVIYENIDLSTKS